MGDLVSWKHQSQLNDSSGFYIHLRMNCQHPGRFAASFLWMRSSKLDGELNLSLVNSVDEGDYVTVSVFCLSVVVCFSDRQLDNSESYERFLKKILMDA